MAVLAVLSDDSFKEDSLAAVMHIAKHTGL